LHPDRAQCRARHRHHVFHPGPGRADPGLDLSHLLPFLCRLRQCRDDRGRHPAGAGIRAVVKAWLGQRLDHHAVAGGQRFGRDIGAYLAPMIGWRGLFLVGLTPALLVLMIRYWVPESPRYLMRMGRYEEARKSLAWALQCDPDEIELPAALPEVEKTSWRELFKYPRSMT